MCVCSESMNEVTDNAKNNVGDLLGDMYIACARPVSENVELLLRNSYVVSYKFDLMLFLGNAFVPPSQQKVESHVYTQNLTCPVCALNSELWHERWMC